MANGTPTSGLISTFWNLSKFMSFLQAPIKTKQDTINRNFCFIQFLLDPFLGTNWSKVLKLGLKQTLKMLQFLSNLSLHKKRLLRAFLLF
jgi:hypothetical protein